jgi:hypothetical protein
VQKALTRFPGTCQQDQSASEPWARANDGAEEKGGWRHADCVNRIGMQGESGHRAPELREALVGIRAPPFDKAASGSIKVTTKTQGASPNSKSSEHAG